MDKIKILKEINNITAQLIEKYKPDKIIISRRERNNEDYQDYSS